mmetsp:Transcript_100343/g.272829  ORF Transcript_100343/g.272829 Transcript_100343/m.272829 type:complete len:283 (+) Transcript_100343:1273-2121(+)
MAESTERVATGGPLATRRPTFVRRSHTPEKAASALANSFLLPFASPSKKPHTLTSCPRPELRRYKPCRSRLAQISLPLFDVAFLFPTQQPGARKVVKQLDRAPCASELRRKGEDGNNLPATAGAVSAMFCNSKSIRCRRSLGCRMESWPTWLPEGMPRARSSISTLPLVRRGWSFDPRNVKTLLVLCTFTLQHGSCAGAATIASRAALLRSSASSSCRMSPRRPAKPTTRPPMRWGWEITSRPSMRSGTPPHSSARLSSGGSLAAWDTKMATHGSPPTSRAR